MKLDITEQDIQILSEALGAMPFSKVAPFITKIQQQINEQNKLTPEVKSEE